MRAFRSPVLAVLVLRPLSPAQLLQPHVEKGRKNRIRKNSAPIGLEVFVGFGLNVYGDVLSTSGGRLPTWDDRSPNAVIVLSIWRR
jgi:hypothetical protein